MDKLIPILLAALAVRGIVRWKEEGALGRVVTVLIIVLAIGGFISEYA